LGEKELTILQSTVTAAADNSALCRKYIADLLERVKANTGKNPISTNVDELFRAIRDSRWQGAPDSPDRGGIFVANEDLSTAGDREIFIGLRSQAARGLVGFDARHPVRAGISGGYMTLTPFLSSLEVGLTTNTS
jgi:hypothetical protein